MSVWLLKKIGSNTCIGGVCTVRASTSTHDVIMMISHVSVRTIGKMVSIDAVLGLQTLLTASQSPIESLAINVNASCQLTRVHDMYMPPGWVVFCGLAAALGALFTCTFCGI